MVDLNKTGALFVAEKPAFCMSFNNTYVETCWADSSLRKYLNKDYLAEQFPEAISQAIIPTKISYNDNTVWKRGQWNNTENVIDRIFILSVEELRQYEFIGEPFTYSSKDGVWLRNPGINNRTAMYFNNSTKDYSTLGQSVTTELFVKPAFYLSTLFIMKNKEELL